VFELVEILTRAHGLEPNLDWDHAVSAFMDRLDPPATAIAGQAALI
jgi:hypothetical protein